MMMTCKKSMIGRKRVTPDFPGRVWPRARQATPAHINTRETNTDKCYTCQETWHKALCVSGGEYLETLVSNIYRGLNDFCRWNFLWPVYKVESDNCLEPAQVLYRARGPDWRLGGRWPSDEKHKSPTLHYTQTRTIIHIEIVHKNMIKLYWVPIVFL